MAQERGSVRRLLAKALHHHYDDIVREPLPRRWVDLILHLEEQERKRAQHSQTGTELRRRPH